MAFSRSGKRIFRIIPLRPSIQVFLVILTGVLAVETLRGGNVSDGDESTLLGFLRDRWIWGDETKSVTEAVNGDSSNSEPNSSPTAHLFSNPNGFEDRISFWIKIYSQYSSEDAVFHDSENLSIIYKVVDLRPITNSELHPFVKEFRVKKLIEKERKILLSELRSLSLKLEKNNLSEREKGLFELLGRPTKAAKVREAIENVRMQLGQKSYIEKAMMTSDAYLPVMEKIFEKKGLPLELTRMPFVESSFNLAARSRVGASGIWQIMPATGRKLMPNKLVDYRNDPIRATEFAATLLKFNYKVIGDWPLAITAYNHGPTSVLRLTKRFGAKDLPTLIQKVYGKHAFAFASSNFYACFLAILEIERNRSRYFPELPRQNPLDFASLQIKKAMSYKQLLGWFDQDQERLDRFNPHLATPIRRGKAKIPAGTYLYVPSSATKMALKSLPAVIREI